MRVSVGVGVGVRVRVTYWVEDEGGDVVVFEGLGDGLDGCC
jgi:hypothetical protein